MLNDNQYQILQPYYKYLKAAKYSNNILIPHNSFIKIMETVYGEHWRNHVPTSVNTCGHCKIQELSKICTMIEDYAKK